jgi:hypothetical protein
VCRTAGRFRLRNERAQEHVGINEAVLDRLQRYLAHGHLGAAADGFKSPAMFEVELRDRNHGALELL